VHQTQERDSEARKKIPIKIRLARLDDAIPVCNVHRSHISRWYRQFGEHEHEVPYSKLSVGERWGFGGAWMSPETCSIHLNNLILKRHYPVVAEKGGHIVGEMEIFFGREGKKFGKNAHIGVLYVKESHTGDRIGTALVEKAKNFAEENSYDTLTVSSINTDAGFYEKCGFKAIMKMDELIVDTKKFNIDNVFEPIFSYDILSFSTGKDMPVGRYQSSAFHIFDMSDAYALPEYLNCQRSAIRAMINGHHIMLIFNTGIDDITSVYGWSDGATIEDIVKSSLTILYSKGIKKARILIDSLEREKLSNIIEYNITGTHNIMQYRKSE
jgi:GNAT superfamily N-acetyltransferase